MNSTIWTNVEYFIAKLKTFKEEDKTTTESKNSKKKNRKRGSTLN